MKKKYKGGHKSNLKSLGSESGLADTGGVVQPEDIAEGEQPPEAANMEEPVSDLGGEGSGTAEITAAPAEETSTPKKQPPKRKAQAPTMENMLKQVLGDKPAEQPVAQPPESAAEPATVTAPEEPVYTQEPEPQPKAELPPVTAPQPPQQPQEQEKPPKLKRSVKVRQQKGKGPAPKAKESFMEKPLPFNIDRKKVLYTAAVVVVTLLISWLVGHIGGEYVGFCDNLALEANGKNVTLAADGFAYPILRYDGMTYLPANPTLAALGYEGAIDNSTSTFVISRIYKGLLPLAEAEASSDATPALKWFNKECEPEHSVNYGGEYADGKRPKVDSSNGLLCWTNTDGADTNTPVNRIKFDVSDYNWLSMSLLSVGDNMLCIYADNEESVPIFQTRVEDYAKNWKAETGIAYQNPKAQTYTIDISSVDTISIGGMSLDGRSELNGDKSYILMSNPLLSR